MRRAAIVAVLLGLVVSALSVRAEGPLVRRDVAWSPIFLTSKNTVYTWTETDARKQTTRYFLALDGLSLRQGPVRIGAPHVLVWFMESESRARRAATLRVYAEGVKTESGTANMVDLVEDERTSRGMALFLEMTSHSSFRWSESAQTLPERPKHPFIDRAEHVRREYEERRLPGEFLVERPLELPKGKWSFTAPTLMFEEQAIFQDPDNPNRLILVLMGNVRLIYRDAVMEADSAVLWVDKARFAEAGVGSSVELYAEGHVRLRHKTGAGREVLPPGAVPGQAVRGLGMSRQVQSVTADRAYVSPSDKRAGLENAELRAQAGGGKYDLVARGQEIYQLDERSSVVVGGQATDCTYAVPHYDISAQNIRLLRVGQGVVATGRNVTAHIHGVPVLWAPYMSTDPLATSLVVKSVNAGSSDRFGVFGQVDWNLKDLGLDPPWMKNFLLSTDYYSKRGPGGGPSGSYAWGKQYEGRMWGEFLGYYINDGAKEDRNGYDIPDPNRGRFLWRNRWTPSRHWRVDAEASYITDAGFLPEYYEQEYEEGKEQETLLFARYLNESTWGGILAKKRINNWQTQVEELPSGELAIVRRPLAGGAVQYDSENLLGYYDLQNGRIADQPDPSGIARFHTEHRAGMPFRIWILHFKPYLRSLLTVASRGRDEEGKQTESPETRFGTGGGIDVSTQMSRIYDVHSDLLGISRIRHIIQPEARFDWLPYVSHGSERFIQMDQVDAIDTEHVVSAGLRQQFQTKRQGRTIDYVTLDTMFVQRNNETIARDAFDPNGENFVADPPTSTILRPRSTEYVAVDLAWQITDRLAFISRENRIALDNGADHYNGGLNVSYAPGFEVFTGLRHVEGRSTSLTVNLAMQLSEKYRLLVLEKYDFRAKQEDGSSGQNLQTRLALQRQFHKWIVELSGTRDEAGNDTTFMVYLKHAGGTSIKRGRQ